MCVRCARSKSRKSEGCGGPRQYTAKKSCGKCHRDKQSCSFNVTSDGQSRKKRKVAEVEDREEGGSSRKSRTSSSRSEEEDESYEWLRIAYAALATAELEVAVARVAVDASVARKKRGEL